MACREPISWGRWGRPHDIVATVSTGCGSMLSAIIATHELERALVPTLAALVPGAAAGLIGEVVIADAGSRDATAEVAEIAGCRFISSSDPLGVRLNAAATSTRSPWLMFLRAGAVPQPGWIDAADHFMQSTDVLGGAARAAVFRPPGACRPFAPNPRRGLRFAPKCLGKRSRARSGSFDLPSPLRGGRRTSHRGQCRNGLAASARSPAHRHAARRGHSCPKRYLT